MPSFVLLDQNTTLVLAYMIIIMLIVVYEVTECQFSCLQQMFHTGNHSIH